MFFLDLDLDLELELELDLGLDLDLDLDENLDLDLDLDLDIWKGKFQAGARRLSESNIFESPCARCSRFGS